MKTKPKFLVTYSLILVLVGLSIPLQVLSLEELFSKNVLENFLNLNPLNIVIILLCLLTSLASFRASRNLKWLIPSLLICVALSNFSVLQQNIGFDSQHIAWATAGFAILHLPLMMGANKEVILNPRSRWWLVPARRSIDVPVSLKTPQGLKFNGRSFDLSQGGLFLKIDPAIFRFKNTSFLENLIHGQKIVLKLSVGRFKEINCQAQVVRMNETKVGQYPPGLGIRFLDLSASTKKDLHKVLNSYLSQPSYLRM